MDSNDLKPGPDLYQRVRAGFVMKGTSLTRWCREKGINPTGARTALTGGWNGPKGRQLRSDLIKASGILASSTMASAIAR